MEIFIPECISAIQIVIYFFPSRQGRETVQQRRLEREKVATNVRYQREQQQMLPGNGKKKWNKKIETTWFEGVVDKKGEGNKR